MIGSLTGAILCSPRENFFSNSSKSRLMDIKLHKQATTTPRIRVELQAALLSC